ncbi:uncharacterized protein LOC144438938 [Glandiceps talaboti]
MARRTEIKETWEKDRVQDAKQSLESHYESQIKHMEEEHKKHLKGIKQKKEFREREVYDVGKVARAADEVKRRETQKLENERKLKDNEKQAKKCKENIENSLSKIQQFKNYKFGDVIGRKTFVQHNLDIEAMKTVRLVVFGPTGAGKSCFINTAQNTFGFDDTCVTQDAAAEGTLHLEAFLTELDFMLVDSRGFFSLKGEYEKELKNIISGRIQINDIIKRRDDDGDVWQNIKDKAADLPDRIHGLICVLEFDDERFEQYRQKMEEYRSFFKEEGYSPVTVVLHKRDISLDSPDDKIAEAALAVGAAADRAFTLTNHYAMETDITDESKAKVVEIIETALIGAETYVKINLLEKKRNAKITQMEKDRLDLDTFLERVQSKYLFKDEEISEFKTQCSENDVTNTKHLKDLEEDLDSLVPIWGMVPLLKFELNKLFGVK